MDKTDSRPQILVIDDDLSLARILSAILEKSGYQTTVVGSGREAIEILSGQQTNFSPSVSLVDIHLPDLSGLEVLREAKKSDPHRDVIMVTGFANVETAITSLNEGAFSYIQKPYNMDEVKATIERVLEKQRLVRENLALTLRLQEWSHHLEKTVEEKTQQLRSKNIDLLKVIEELKAANELKSKFIASASHEFQTPMTSILGFSDMLLEHWREIEGKKKIHYLKIIQKESQRLANLVKDLLDISQTQNQPVELKFEMVDLKLVTEKVSKNIKRLKRDTKIELHFESDAREVRTDLNKVEKVFSYLLIHILRYGLIHSKIKIFSKRERNNIVVSVVGSGVCIPADQREKVFEPFYYIRNGRDQMIHGSGLELSICKVTIQALGGRIYLEGGEEQKGNCFTLIFPVLGA